MVDALASNETQHPFGLSSRAEVVFMSSGSALHPFGVPGEHGLGGWDSTRATTAHARDRAGETLIPGPRGTTMCVSSLIINSFRLNHGITSEIRRSLLAADSVPRYWR